MSAAAMASRVEIVVTPGSGSGRAMAVANRVRRGLEAQGYAPSVRAFRTLGELEAWTATCEATFSHLVAVGGDATISAVAGAAVRLAVPFAPVPSGFGNLFTRAFEHSGEPEAVVDLFGRGELVWTDVGIAGDEMFLSHRSYGFLEQIQQEVERLRRPRQRLLRLFTYFRAAATHLSDKSREAIELAIDGRPIPGKAALVAIANVETYRGFLSLTPAASPVDGVFDICVIPRATPARVLGQLVKLMLGVPSCRAGIRLYRGRQVRVNRRKLEDVRLLERALPLLVPAGSLARLQARQVAAEAEVTFVTPAPPEPVASGRGPAGAPARPARSRRPVVVGEGG